MTSDPDPPISPEMAVTAGDFAGLMARFEPFEPEPRLAVAVSGGADSLALCLLCQEWAQARGGRVLALTVDHGLRPESTAEAVVVGRQLAGRGIEHGVLTWTGAKPATGLQEAARAARYRLMIGHCAQAATFHLLLAHHREDQAETLLLRLVRSSGVDGLAAMAAVREVAELRLLRPLLDLPKARLVETCRAAGLGWVEDPSNRSERFARARLRNAVDVLGREGLNPEGLAETARRLGQARVALDCATAALLAEAATVDGAGFVRLLTAPVLAAPGEIGRRALARCLAVVGGGGGHPPRRERLDRLFREIADGLEGGRTLGGCRLVPYGRHLLIVREHLASDDAVALVPEQRVWWDHRFLVRLKGGVANCGGVTVNRLSSHGWIQVREQVVPALHRAIPEPVRGTLPALWDEAGVLAVPHLGFTRPGAAGKGAVAAEMIFAPAMPLAGAGFGVA